MALSAVAASIETSHDTRGRHRRTLRLDADVRAPRPHSAQTVIHNISETGLLIETPLDLVVGDPVTIEMPHAGTTIAKVVWASDHLFGCKFSETITPGAVSAALLRSGFGSQHFVVESGYDVDQYAQSDEAERLAPGARLWSIIGLSALCWAAPAAAALWIFG